MSDFPQSRAATPLFVHTWTLNSALHEVRTMVASSVPVSLTWVANLAVYVPVVIPYAYPVNRVFWGNGSAAPGSSNADFGIYAADGTAIYRTGSTALVGTSVPQYVTPSTPFLLSPGRYYFAYACDNTTNRSFGVAATATLIAMAGLLQEASALPLPATMTPATMSNALVPLCGITRTTTGF